MNTFRLVIVVLTMLASCKTTIQTHQTSDPYKIGVKANKFRGTIFKSDYPKDKLYILAVDSLERFTPTKEEIGLAEAILKEKIKHANSQHINQSKRSQIIEKNLNNYFRQYVGFVNENGERLIHINFYWDKFTMVERIKGIFDDRLDYTSDYQLVLDGGSRYWTANVNLTTKTIDRLTVNGIA